MLQRGALQNNAQSNMKPGINNNSLKGAPQPNNNNKKPEAEKKPEPVPEPEPVQIYKTMYPDSEIVKYEGEMQNGKRHGQGKSFYKSGQLMYEGTFIEDLPDDNGDKVI